MVTQASACDSSSQTKVCATLMTRTLPLPVLTALRFLRNMNNEEIARRFNRMASLMEVRGEDSFRIRSYRMAAEAIETWPTQMKEIAAQTGLNGLLDIPGVGKALAGKI